MNDSDLADVLIERLNALIEDPEVRADIARLIETRVPVGIKTGDHPTIQVAGSRGAGDTLGFLGLLNGIVGVQPSGPREGWGFIAVLYDDAGTLVRFQRAVPPAGT